MSPLTKLALLCLLNITSLIQSAEPLANPASLDPLSDLRWGVAVSCEQPLNQIQAAEHLAAAVGVKVDMPTGTRSQPLFQPPVASLPARHYLPLLAWHYDLGYDVEGVRVTFGAPSIVGACGLFSIDALLVLPDAFDKVDSAALQWSLRQTLGHDERHAFGHFGMSVSVHRDLLFFEGYRRQGPLLDEWLAAVTRPLDQIDSVNGVPVSVWPLQADDAAGQAHRAWRSAAGALLARPAGTVSRTDEQGRDWRSLRVEDAASAVALAHDATTGIMIHPSLLAARSKSRASGLNQTVASGLRMFARDAGGRVVLRHGMVLVEPEPDMPLARPSVRIWACPKHRPTGWSDADLVAFIDRYSEGKVTALVLSDRLLLVGKGNGPTVGGLISALHRHFGTERTVDD